MVGGGVGGTTTNLYTIESREVESSEARVSLAPCGKAFYTLQ